MSTSSKYWGTSITAWGVWFILMHHSRNMLSNNEHSDMLGCRRCNKLSCPFLLFFFCPSKIWAICPQDLEIKKVDFQCDKENWYRPHSAYIWVKKIIAGDGLFFKISKEKRNMIEEKYALHFLIWNFLLHIITIGRLCKRWWHKLMP
jgi:hypothetical protein